MVHHIKCAGGPALVPSSTSAEGWRRCSPVLPVPFSTMRSRLTLAVAAIAALPVVAPAQQLEPRAYSPSPVDANFAGVAYGYSTGGILFDPSIPITNAHADINATTFGYGRTYGFLGMQGLVTASLPYAWGNLKGQVGAQNKDSMVTRSGLGDAEMKLSLNFIGSPALSPKHSIPRPRSHSFSGVASPSSRRPGSTTRTRSSTSA